MAQARSVRAIKNKAVRRLGGPLRRPASKYRAHRHPEIEAADMDQIGLVHVLASAQPCAAHAAALQDTREPHALDDLAAPAQITLGRLRLRDARLPVAAVQIFENLSE